MVLFISSNIQPWIIVTMDITWRILLTILVMLIALGLGLILRRLLIRSLRKTVLDNWILQTLGIVVVLPPLIIAAVGAIGIWDPYQLLLFLIYARDRTQLPALAVNLLETLLLIALGIGLARTINTLTIRGLVENHIDINIRKLLGRIFYIIVITVMGFWILSIWQLSIGVPVAAIGVITVAFTVSIQDILKDLVAGFYILLERPFHIGDQITTATYTGKVEDVQLRATKLRLVSGEEITIPNTIVFGNTVVNNTLYPERRATIVITLPEEDFVKDETPAQVAKVIKGLANIVVKPEPSVLISGFSEKKYSLTVRFWIMNEHFSTVSDAMYALHAALPTGELFVNESGGNV